MTGTRQSTAPPSGDTLGTLNAVRVMLVLAVGFGYASTMARGPETREWLAHLGSDPSWFGLQALFFLSGYLGWRSLMRGRTGLAYLRSRALRTLPVLALYTTAVVTLIYPVICAPGTMGAEAVTRLASYWAKTVSLVAPGGVMPGALDDAAYACLIQGTVWTLRWGACAHIGLVICHAVGLRRPALLAGTVLSTAAMVALAPVFLRGGMGELSALAPGIRFAYPFLLGACAFAFRDRLPKGARTWLGLALGCTALGGLTQLLPIAAVTEVFGTLAWCAAAMAGLGSRARLLTDWPPLALPLYLGVWPAAQLWLLALPGITTPALIACSLGSALALAYAVVLSSRVLSPPAASQLNSPRTA